MKVTEIYPCVTGMKSRKDTLEVQKTSSTTLFCDQVALGKITLSLSGNPSETKRCSYSAIRGLRQTLQRGNGHGQWPGYSGKSLQ